LATDQDNVYVDFVRDGIRGSAMARSGNPRWRRLTEVRARAKSVFHFDVQGSVAKSTHAGIPWLRHLRQRTAGRVHFWPFDGWQIPSGRSVVAEVYPALWNRSFPREDRDSHQQDAYFNCCVDEPRGRGRVSGGFLSSRSGARRAAEGRN